MMGSLPSRFERRQKMRRGAGPRGRRPRPRRHQRLPRPLPAPGASPGVLHHLAALLTLASRPRAAAEADNLGRQQRRQRQHLALAQRLLDPLPVSLRAGGHGAELFWRAVRFGGAGVLLAWWLMR
jgi:hypothetical protein